MNKESRTKILVMVVLIAFSFTLIMSLTQTTFAFLNTTCVVAAPCQGTPPPGKCCTGINLSGSTAQDGGVEATSTYCSYVYDGSNPGTACGSAVPDGGSNCH